jgi:hypothetical protein
VKSVDLKLVGSVIELLEEQSGEGRNGPWRKRDFILETEGPYPKQVCITQWGDDIEAFDLHEGDRLTAHIDLRSREYQGRWYTDVRAWKVEKGEGDEGPADSGAEAGGRGRAEGGGRGRAEGGGRGRAEGGGRQGGEGAGSRRSASGHPRRQDSEPSEESDDDLPF